MSFCNQCGTELPDGAAFCANCGAATASQAASTTTGYGTAADPIVSRDNASRPDLIRPVGSTSIGRWLLPALVAVALVVIGYLLLVPGKTPRATGSSEMVAADAGASAESGRSRADSGERRAVDTASDAADQAGATTRAASTVSAAALDSAFNRDPAGATRLYAGPIRVSGTIATMVQPGPSPALSLEGRTRFNYMIVEFPEGYRTRLAPLAKGQFVSVACEQVRALGGTTILSGCLLT